MKPIFLLLAAAGAAGWLCASPTRATVGLGEAPHLLPASIVQTIADKTYKVGPLVVEAPWARATPGGAQVGGAYLKITNTGAETDRLIGGSLPIATSVEVHEMSMTDGVMRMRKLEKGLEIKTLGVPVDEAFAAAPCAVCGKQAKDTLRFARTY